MDKEELMVRLAAYRAADADDPVFVEAIRAVKDDPDLAAWFAEMQAFDMGIAAQLRAIPAPAELKRKILAERPPAQVHDVSWWRGIGALAALLLIGVICQQVIEPPRTPLRGLAAQAISYTEKMPALQFVCFDAGAVAHWINEQPGARQIGVNITRSMEGMSMAMIGSSVVQWGEHPVVMIALQHGDRMAMLYILREGDVPGLPVEKETTVQQADWVVHASHEAGQVRLLTAKGTAKDLIFTGPF